MAFACVAPFNSLARQEDEDEDDLSSGLFKGAIADRTGQAGTKYCYRVFFVNLRLNRVKSSEKQR